MTSADPFTKASPHYVAAMRTCDKTGDAFEVSGGNITGLLSGCAALIVFAFAVGFAGYCHSSVGGLMKMSPAYESRVREVLAGVRRAAERADQARDTDAMIQALGAVRDATIKAAFVVREADEAMRAGAVKSKEIVA